MRMCILFLAGTGLAACLYYAIRALRMRRLMTGTPTTKIEDITGGLTELSGRVPDNADILEAPISGQECAYYRIKIEQYRSQKDSGGWHQVLEASAPDWMTIDDGTGIAAICLADATFELGRDIRSESGGYSGAPEKIRERLSSKYGFDTKGWVFNKRLRYTEFRLSSGDMLYAIGEATAGEPPTLKAGPKGLLLSDRPEAILAAGLQFRFVGFAAGAIGSLIVLILALSK